MNTKLEINLADILEDKYPHGFHAPADIEISNFLEFADDDWMHEIDIQDLLKENRQVGLFWTVQDVIDARPDLDDERAWVVLKACRPHFDPLADLMRETIKRLSADLFPKPSGKAALRAYLARIERRIEALPEEESKDPAAYGSVAAELDTASQLAKGE